MSRVRYFAFRAVQTVFMLWLALTLLFFFFRMMPGDYTDLMLHQGASPESVEAFRESWGLDDPLHVQYYRYLINLLQGDAGTSLVYRVPVWGYIKNKIFNSFILIAPGITLAYLLGSAYGTIAGTNRGSVIEKYGIVPVIFLGSFPAFVTAIFLVIIFAGTLDWFPTSGMLSGAGRGTLSEVSWWRPYLSADFAHHYVLPFTAVVLRYLYLPSLVMRTSVIEVMGQAFTEYHRRTGISRFAQLRHLGKHASLPVITIYPVSMTRAIGGLVLIEAVFNWPGIGSALIESVFSRDFPIIQVVFFIVAAFIIIANFVVDVLYGIIDPRVSVGDG